MKKIFIGGWCHTGSRLIVKILQNKGYNILENLLNQQCDYMAHGIFLNLVKNYYLTNDLNILFDIIDQDTKNSDSICVLKHGHFILLLPELKKRYPDSIFIATIRHPLDALLHADPNYNLLGGIGINPPLEDKFIFYKKWHKYLDQANYIIKLEDLVLDKYNTIRSLCDFLGCDNNTDIASIIGPPSQNVERWKTHYKDIEIPDEIQHYITSLDYSL